MLQISSVNEDGSIKKLPTRLPAKVNSIIVTPFADEDYTIFGPLGKAMSALLRADLRLVPDISIIDRVNLQMLLKIMAHEAPIRFDVETTTKVIKMLQAEHAITGALTDLKSDNMQINSTLSGVRKNPAPRKAVGRISHFYDLQKQIACDMVTDIGKKCDALPKAFKKIHTRSFPALIAYGWGLDHCDQGKYNEARDKFQLALKNDPHFELAELALLATPSTTMALMPTSQLIALAAENGPSPAFASSAVVRGKWKHRTKVIAGGLVLATGAAVLAGSGSSSGGGPPPKKPEPVRTPNVDGSWEGTIKIPDENISLEMNLAQSESGGNITAGPGWDCMTSGRVAFSFSGNQINIIAESNSGVTLHMNGDCPNDDCIKIDGNLEIRQGSGNANCENITGSFNIYKLTSGEIHW